MKYIYIGIYGCGVHNSRFIVGAAYNTPNSGNCNGNIEKYGIWMVDEFGHIGLHDLKYFKTINEIREEKLIEIGI
jgi:hypothetical protein